MGFFGICRAAKGSVYAIPLIEVDYAQIELWTVLPGPALADRWGQSSLHIRSRDGKSNWVYYWGSFRSGAPSVYGQLLQGTAVAELTASAPSRFVGAFRKTDRVITAQPLGLDVASKNRLLRLINANLQPKNRAYRYDYRTRNSTSAIRDLIDRSLGGELSDHFGGQMTRTTARQLIRDGLGGRPVVSLLLEFGLGGGVDKTATKWELMAWPMALKAYLAEFAAPGGGERLLGEEREVLEGERFYPENWRLAQYAGVAFGWALGIMILLSLRGVLPLGILKGSVLFLCGLTSLLGAVSAVLWVAGPETDLSANVLLLVFWPIDIGLAWWLLNEGHLPAPKRRALLRWAGWFKVLAFHALLVLTFFRLIDRNITYLYLVFGPAYVLLGLGMAIGMDAIRRLRAA